MKLSVIIPCYNLEDYILPCLHSVLTQQLDAPFEVLVADDASTDQSPTRLTEYAENWRQQANKGQASLKLFLREKNLGLRQNLQDMLNQAQGQYIAYLDGDDLALPGKLAAQVAYLDQQAGCSICYHESQCFDSDTGEARGLYSRDFYNARYVPELANLSHLIRYGTFLQASAVMFRRHDGLDGLLDPQCRIIVDYPMHVANAGELGGTIDRLPKVLGKYRLHDSSFGAQTARNLARREEVLGELLRTCERSAEWGVPPEVIEAGKAHFRFAAALYFLRQGAEDQFLSTMTESAEGECFFDERHRWAFAHRLEPQRVKRRFFPQEHIEA